MAKGICGIVYVALKLSPLNEKDKQTLTISENAKENSDEENSDEEDTKEVKDNDNDDDNDDD